MSTCGHSLKECLEVAPSGGRCCVACTGRHAVNPYRTCFECGHVYDTVFELVVWHLSVVQDAGMEFTLEQCVPELIYSCPTCTHDF